MQFYRFVPLAVLAAASARGAELEVLVKDTSGQPLPGATAALAEPARECVTDAEGACRLEIPAGHRDLSVRLAGFAGARVGTEVAEGRHNRLEVKLSDSYHFNEAVTVSPGGRDTFEAYQPTSVLAAEALQQRVGASLGETLSREVGVNARSLGPGPSRPVVRGLDGDRVLVLENGSRTGDLSSQSADHGVNVDPASASQIEVVRGPATLLYGSNALGGVVNLVSDDIPRKPVTGTHGAVLAQAATANAEAGAAGNLTVGNGRFALRLHGNGHRTSDVDTPQGEVPNTQSRSASGGGALAWTGEHGYLGASYQYVDSKYGVPFLEEGETQLTPRRHAIDLRGERRDLPGFFSGLKVQGSYRDYRHDEIEGSGEIATSFRNRTGEAELLLSQRPSGRLKGTIGIWGLHRDYSSAGEEALAPPTRQRGFAAFGYEELGFHHVSLQFGARLDHTSFQPDALSERPELRDRSFTNVSASLGLVGYLRHDLTLAVNLARAARNPSLEELYNLGPHAGNFSFEIGSPELGTEVGLGADVSLRYRGERLTGELTLFRNAISDFVFPAPTGEVEDDLPVVEFRQADSTLLGAEFHTDVRLGAGFWVELGADAVRGELDGSGEPLPRMPPYRGWAALRYQTRRFHLEAELRSARRQDRLHAAETATRGHAVVNLHGSYTFTQREAAHTITLRLDNAADELYRNHLSYIKDLVPEMGRSLKVVYGVRF